MDKKWYVVYTKSGSEKKVSEIFSRKKIENLVPVNKVWGKNDNIKEIPLFKNYVFVKTIELQHREIKKINDVINFVYWIGKPVIIKNSEIKVIKLFLNEYENVTLEKININSANSHFLDLRNDNNGLGESPMVTIKNKKAYVGLPSLGYVMTAEAETPNVRIISLETSLKSAESNLEKILNKGLNSDNSLRSF